MDFPGKRRVEMNGIGKQLRYEEDKESAAKHGRSGDYEIKEKGNLGFIVLNPRGIGGEQVQFLDSRSRDQAQQGVAEFVNNSAGHEEPVNRFRIDILCPQPAGCVTEEDNHDETNCQGEVYHAKNLKL